MEKKKYMSKYETNLFVLDTVEGTSRSFWTEKEKERDVKKTLLLLSELLSFH